MAASTRIGTAGRVFAYCAASLLAFGQCGCMTSLSEYVHNGFKVGPNYQRPPVPVVPEWIDQADARVKPGDPNLISWWDDFDDPVLTDLIHRAFKDNLSVRAAAFQILQAREQRAIAFGELFPQTQAASLQYLRVQASQNGASSSGGVAAGAALAPAAVLSPLGTGLTGTNGVNPVTGASIGGGGGGGGGGTRFFSNWSTSVNLAWELDFWGLFRRNLESANASLDQSVFNYDEVVVLLVANVATQYVEIRTLQKRLELARKNVAEIEPLVAILQQRYKAGTQPLPDYLQLKATLENTKALIPQLEITLRQSNNQLCTLLGISVRDLLPELGDGTVPGATEKDKRYVRIPRPKSNDVVVDVPSNLLLRRPDVMAAEQQLRIQSAHIGMAEAEMYPHIGINGSLGLAAADFNKLFSSNSGTGTIGPSLTWNIFNYGRLLANVRFQNLQYQQFVANYLNTILNANLEAENAMIGYLRSQDQHKHLQESADAAAETVRYLIKQRGEGFLPKGQDTAAFINQLFTVNNFSVTQQDAAAQAEGNIALNLILLYRSMGGGWQIRCGQEHHDMPAVPEAPFVNAPAPARPRFGTPTGAVVPAAAVENHPAKRAN